MSIGIDEPLNLSGFTIRELLLEAAGLASEENAPEIRKITREMRDLFGKPGTPSLSPRQVEAYVDMVSLAVDYESSVTPYPPGEFASVDDRRAYAVTQHMTDLMHAVRHLGEH